MAIRLKRKLRKCLCWCYSVKVKPHPHKYCGCEESRKLESKSRWSKVFKMKTVKTSDTDTTDVDNDRTQVEEDADEAVDVLEYEFMALPESERSFNEPEIPFSHEFTEALHPQFDIIIRGTIDLRALRFAVNLLSKHNEKTDIVFHFNPRFNARLTALNSNINGKWGRERYAGYQKFPFHRGFKFFLEIFLTHSEFLVAVNGVHYGSFPFRAPLVNVTHLQIEGGATLSHVNLQYTSFYPSPLPLEYPPSPYKFALPQGITKNETKTTPVYGNLLGKLKPGSEIVINGQVELLPFRFFINLQEGSHIWPHPEIPLHISVRFINGEDEVRVNSWIDTNWGKEEIQEKCIFTPGYDFTLRITCTEDAFVALVDDEPQLSFKHRVPYTHIDTLHIQGEIFVYDIRINL